MTVEVEVEPDEGPEDTAPPAVPPAATDGTPTVETLQAEVDRLREGNRRNNQELVKRRHVEQWMRQHGIDDLDTWLADLGVDKQTGQRASAPPAGPPTASEAEVARLIALETEKLQAQHEEAAAGWEARHGKLSGYVKRSAVEAALSRAGFSGTLDKALRVLNLNEITVAEDDDGEPVVSGVDEAITSLRDEIPEWFRQRPARPPRQGGEDVDGARKPPRPPARATWEQQILDRALGGGRRA